jgi:Ca-activated chloride channel family protein
MTFGAPQWLWGLLLIPLLIALFVRAEQRGLKRLQEFVSARLLPQLAGTVNRPRRILRFALQLLGLALVIVSLAQPRWGYTFEDVKRKGLDLLIAVDTSRSMLSNDVQPNRLDRVKLAIQDLISQLQGDRVGLIAFAGRAFLQAPLTIDYDAVVEAVNDLDTKTIPEGGTNISSDITLATQSFGKSAMGNRVLVIFTDGEELSGDAVKTAKEAADAGVRIFTVGVGTPQGSLIPVTMVKSASLKIHPAKSLNRSWMINVCAKSLRLLADFIFTWKTDPARCSKFRMKAWQKCRRPKWMCVYRVGRLSVTSGRWALP